MDISFKKLNPNAVLPAYATDGSGCFDMAVPRGAAYRIAPGQTVMAQTGLACAFPKGFVMLMYSRSGHGFKNNVRLANCVGVIDADYRGELMAAVRNEGSHVFDLVGGDRFAQAMIVTLPWVNIWEVDELPPTARGEGGFGSTG